MNFLEIVGVAKAHLQKHRRVSLSALRREFALEDDVLQELVEELVEIQGVAKRDGKALAWRDLAASSVSEMPSTQAGPRLDTPKHLAERVRASRSVLEGERKKITILFADIKGSMALAEHVDPEAWDALLEPFFEILTNGIHRFEGTVNQYTGDGIMALFGAPIAHENHAQRACYAALHLREALRSYSEHLRRTQGIDFAVRIGLNSGEVIVRKISADLRMEFTALGHSVGLAQRMEALAEPGTIYLTDATQRLVKGFFALRDLGLREIKGSREPVRVLRLEGLGRLRTRLEVSRTRGLSRFVGRSEEMATLDEALERTQRGHGQVVGVVGEAGVGKSRLCLEFLERCRARRIPIYEAHCPPHAKGVPLLPILELLRNAFAIAENDSPAEVRAKVTRDLLALDVGFRSQLPALLDFLGVRDPEAPAPQTDPERRRHQLFSVFRKIMQIRGKRGLNSVTLIDDLHWIDPGSDAFLAQLVDAFEGSRGLLLVNFRPEYDPPWRRRRHYQEIPLARLRGEAVHELVGSLLGTDPSLEGLSQRIETAAAGNPLFTEEIIQSLIDGEQLVGEAGAYRLLTAVEHLEVPSSVQSILAGRIDRLSATAKHVLRAAAVIGKVFERRILAAVAGVPESDFAGVIERLRAIDFINERALYPNIEYAFTHPLSHEVAYEAQLRDQKAKTHARVAQAIQDLEPERLDERAALIAHHWEHANEPGQAATWHQRAAGWSLLNEPEASLRHWRRVLELARELPVGAKGLSLGALANARILNLGWQLGLREEDAARCFEDGKELAERAGDLKLLAELHGAYGSLRGVNQGFANEYVRWAREAVRFADQTDDVALQSSMKMRLVQGYLLSGRHDQVSELAEHTLYRVAGGDRGDSAVSPTPALAAMKGLAHALLGGSPGETRRCLDEAAILSSSHGWCEVEIYVISIEVFWLVFRGEWAASLARANEITKLAEALGTSLAHSWASLSMGRAQLANGDAQTASESFEEVLRIAKRSRSSGYIIDSTLAGLSDSYLAQGRLEEAHDRAEEAVGFARDHGLALDLSPWLSRARSLTALGRRTAARQALEEAQQRISETGAKIYQPLWHECDATVAGRFDNPSKRDRALRAAHHLYGEMGAIAQVERVARNLSNP